MARPWRIQFPDAIYHVIGRGNNQQKIFLDGYDKEKFIELLFDASYRFNLVFYAFCLMDNHYHLFFRTPDANLSSALHWINGTYTSRFHHRHHGCGHLFQGRYKSVLVTDDAHWLHLSMYIHLNPVRAGIVEDPAEYEWSSFHDYTHARTRFGWVRPDEILTRYGTTDTTRRRRYRKDCLMLGGKNPDFWEQFTSEVVLGSREVVEQLTRKYRPDGKVQSVPDFRSASRPEFIFEEETARVADVFKTDVEGILRKRRDFPARMALYYHLIENCGMKVTNVASLLGVSSSGVSKGLARFKKNLEVDKNLLTMTKLLSSKSSPDPRPS